MAKNNEIREKQIKDWERRYEKVLSEEDYKQICVTLDDFVTLLRKWDKQKPTGSFLGKSQPNNGGTKNER